MRKATMSEAAEVERDKRSQSSLGSVRGTSWPAALALRRSRSGYSFDRHREHEGRSPSFFWTTKGRALRLDLMST